MTRKSISFDNLLTKTHDLWAHQYFLLTSGDFTKSHFNTMTVAWGSLGYLWEKPFAQVFVRPQRYTYEFMEQYPTFTLCAFPQSYREALEMLGTQSGRDGDKIAESRLTPIASQKVAAPSFAEAELIIECRKIYWQDLDSTHFLDSKIHKNYAMKDYHRIYFGEVVAIEGMDEFISASEG
jgi:flavin reductase (DIM6/NTAB) family NADH-FMN oxidoreductase RutF